MKTLNFVSAVTFLCLCASLAAFGQGSNVVVKLECPTTFVQGLPALSSISIRNTSERITQAVPKLDLSSDVNQGMGITFIFTPKAKGVPFVVGYGGYGRPELEIGPRPPRYELAPGEEVTLTFDLNQLLIGKELRRGTALPSPGAYGVSASFYHGAWESPPVDVTIRERTAEEDEFVDAMQKQNVGKKWFPKVVESDEINLPESVSLPGESEELRDYIKILRLAVRKPAAALKEIEKNKGTWRHLANPMAELEYECAANVTGKKSQKASQIRSRLQDVKTMNGRFTRFDKSGSLLDRFTEKRKEKKADK